MSFLFYFYVFSFGDWPYMFLVMGHPYTCDDEENRPKRRVRRRSGPRYVFFSFSCVFFLNCVFSSFFWRVFSFRSLLALANTRNRTTRCVDPRYVIFFLLMSFLFFYVFSFGNWPYMFLVMGHPYTCDDEENKPKRRVQRRLGPRHVFFSFSCVLFKKLCILFFFWHVFSSRSLLALANTRNRTTRCVDPRYVIFVSSCLFSFFFYVFSFFYWYVVSCRPALAPVIPRTRPKRCVSSFGR